MCIRVAIRAPKLKASTIQKVRAENYRFPPHVQNSSYFKTCSLLASFIILNEPRVSTLGEQSHLYNTPFKATFFWIDMLSFNKRAFFEYISCFFDKYAVFG